MTTTTTLTKGEPIVWPRLDADALRDVLRATTESLHALLVQCAEQEEDQDFATQWGVEAEAVGRECAEALAGSAQQQWHTFIRHSQREDDLLELRDWMKTHPIPA